MLFQWWKEEDVEGEERRPEAVVDLFFLKICSEVRGEEREGVYEEGFTLPERKPNRQSAIVRGCPVLWKIRTTTKIQQRLGVFFPSKPTRPVPLKGPIWELGEVQVGLVSS